MTQTLDQSDLSPTSEKKYIIMPSINTAFHFLFLKTVGRPTIKGTACLLPLTVFLGSSIMCIHTHFLLSMQIKYIYISAIKLFVGSL